MTNNIDEKFKSIIDELKKFAIDGRVNFLMKDIPFADSTYNAICYPLLKIEINIAIQGFQINEPIIKIKTTHTAAYANSQNAPMDRRWIFDSKSSSDEVASEEVMRSIIIYWPKIKDYFTNLVEIRKSENKTIEDFNI